MNQIIRNVTYIILKNSYPNYNKIGQDYEKKIKNIYILY